MRKQLDLAMRRARAALTVIEVELDCEEPSANVLNDEYFALLQSMNKIDEHIKLAVDDRSTDH